MSKKTKVMNVNTIREILADEIERLRNDQRTPAAVNAVTNAVGKILGTVKMEMEYAKMLGVVPHIDFITIVPSTRKTRKELTEGETEKKDEKK